MGFYYSHDGKWNGVRTYEGYTTKMECANTCIRKQSCIAISTYGDASRGNCYHYSSRAELVRSNEEILEAKAYIKCLGTNL